MFGLLVRLGLQALTNFDGAAVFPLAWVQGMGCLIMGIAAGLREPISQLYVGFTVAIGILFTHLSSSYAPLYFAIATGALFWALQDQIQLTHWYKGSAAL